MHSDSSNVVSNNEDGSQSLSFCLRKTWIKPNFIFNVIFLGSIDLRRGNADRERSDGSADLELSEGRLGAKEPGTARKRDGTARKLDPKNPPTNPRTDPRAAAEALTDNFTNDKNDSLRDGALRADALRVETEGNAV